jgi:hypothetical protein
MLDRDSSLNRDGNLETIYVIVLKKKI